MLRFVLAIAMSVAFVACALDPPSASPTRDVTGILVAPASSLVAGCPANSASGNLVVDATSGVAIEAGDHLPVVWPAGFKARTVDGAIEVVDRAGRVVARTGTTVTISGGRVNDRWVTCGDVSPVPS